MVDLLKSSISMYSKNDLKAVERLLKNADLVSTEEEIENSTIDSLTFITNMLEVNPGKVQEVIEKFEIEKLYKYSSIFEVSNSDTDLVDKLEALLRETKVTTTEDNLTISKYPYKGQDTYILKFLKYCVGVKLIDGEPKTYSARYPMLAVYYPDDNIVEIRVHTISRFLRNDKKDFYNESISEVRRGFESKFLVNLDSIPLDSAVNYIAEHDNAVKVSSQKMQLANGGDATLNSSQSSDETVLPILGELSAIISDNSDLFEASKECQQIK